jgi:hypothetical protein
MKSLCKMERQGAFTGSRGSNDSQQRGDIRSYTGGV